MQLTYKDGPFAGLTEVKRWPDERVGTAIYRPYLAAPRPAAWLSESELPLNVPYFTATYRIDFVNETATAGTAKLIDDGKPKCKSPARCFAMEHRMNEFKVMNPAYEVVKTKGCGSCGRPLAFEVRQ